MKKPKLRVAVTGGRFYMDYFNVQRALNKVTKKFDVTIIHGDCPTGADHWADVYCNLTGTPQEKYPAKWKQQGDAAGFERNTWMVEHGRIDLCLVFPGSNGTTDMANKCLTARIPIKQIGAREDDRTQGHKESAAESQAGEVQRDTADTA